MIMRACKVHVNGRFAGTLEEINRDYYTFSYDRGYLSLPDASPVSVNLPLTEETYISDSLFPFFCNMLSEGYNRNFQIKYHHLEPDDDFGLLLKTATYDTIGNVTVEETV